MDHICIPNETHFTHIYTDRSMKLVQMVKTSKEKKISSWSTMYGGTDHTAWIEESSVRILLQRRPYRALKRPVVKGFNSPEIEERPKWPLPFAVHGRRLPAFKQRPCPWPESHGEKERENANKTLQWWPLERCFRTKQRSKKYRVKPCSTRVNPNQLKTAVTSKLKSTKSILSWSTMFIMYALLAFQWRQLYICCLAIKIRVLSRLLRLITFFTSPLGNGSSNRAFFPGCHMAFFS